MCAKDLFVMGTFCILREKFKAVFSRKEKRKKLAIVGRRLESHALEWHSVLSIGANGLRSEAKRFFFRRRHFPVRMAGLRQF